MWLAYQSVAQAWDRLQEADHIQPGDGQILHHLWRKVPDFVSTHSCAQGATSTNQWFGCRWWRSKRIHHSQHSQDLPSSKVLLLNSECCGNQSIHEQALSTGARSRKIYWFITFPVGNSLHFSFPLVCHWLLPRALFKPGVRSLWAQSQRRNRKQISAPFMSQPASQSASEWKNERTNERKSVDAKHLSRIIEN